MKKISFISALVFAIAFSSCKMANDLQIEKRHYGKGYYVHVRNSHTDVASVENGTGAALVSDNVSPENNLGGTTVSPENISTSENQSKILSNKSAVSNNSSKQHSPFAKNENKKANSVENKTSVSISKNQTPSSEPAGNVSQLVLVILAILISPLAIYLKEGVTMRFWVDLICWLLGYGVVGFAYYAGGLVLFAVVFALLIVLDII